MKLCEIWSEYEDWYIMGCAVAQCGSYRRFGRTCCVSFLCSINHVPWRRRQNKTTLNVGSRFVRNIADSTRLHGVISGNRNLWNEFIWKDLDIHLPIPNLIKIYWVILDMKRTNRRHHSLLLLFYAILCKERHKSASEPHCVNRADELVCWAVSLTERCLCAGVWCLYAKSVIYGLLVF